MNAIPPRPMSHKEELQMLGIALFSRTNRYEHAFDLNPELIIELVCKDYHITKEELLSTYRGRPLTQIRQVLMWYFHKELGLTQLKAASYFQGNCKDGAKDHSTTVHACAVVANMNRDSLIAYHFNRVMRVINVDLDITKAETFEDRIIGDLRILFGKQQTLLDGNIVAKFIRSYGIDRHKFNTIIGRAEVDKLLRYGLSSNGKKTIQFI